MKFFCLVNLILSGLLVVLGGCYEDISVTLHKSHVYKGASDPHKDDPKIREEKLNRRFELVQTDR